MFCEELAGRSTKTGLDFDKYDTVCDHLIIIHKESKTTVGTYRINLSQTPSELYTNSEFEIAEWVGRQTNSFIELGRACIHHEHRRGIVISLLWRGIAEYMKMANADLLLGCSSVKVTDTRSAAMVFKYFEINGHLSPEIFNPRKKFQMKDFLFWMMVFSKGLNENQMLEAEEKIPSLLKSYIKAGAKVASYPALDMDFNCIDLITTLKRSEMDHKLAKKFNT